MDDITSSSCQSTSRIWFSFLSSTTNSNQNIPLPLSIEKSLLLNVQLIRFAPTPIKMKSELYFLAKAALVLTVVDAFIPRAETFVKNKAKTEHDDTFPQSSDDRHDWTSYPHSPHHPHQQHFPQPQSYPYVTEIRMGLFDMNPFHGGGSGASKQALDEQWEVQQAILRERRGHHDVHFTKKGNVPAEKIEPASKKKIQVDIVPDTENEHKKSLVDLFFGAKKFH